MLSPGEAFIGVFSRITFSTIRAQFRRMGMPRLKPFLPQNFDLRRVARTIRLEKLSAPFLSHFENSQNLNVSPPIADTFVLAQLRNYATITSSRTMSLFRIRWQRSRMAV